MRPKRSIRQRGGFATWIKLNAADEVIAENTLIWNALDDVTKGKLIIRRATELQRDYEARVNGEGR